jgi:hypothetical protein
MLVDETNQRRNVLRIAFENDIRLILWSFFAILRSLILRFASEIIS